MSKVYYKCEECGISFPEDQLVLTNKLELTCTECIEEAEKDRRVHNATLVFCVLFALSGIFVIYKIFLS